MTLKIMVRPPKPNEEELKALFENLDLLIQHKDKIFQTPDLYSVRVCGAGIFPLYISPIRLSVGELLRLWTAGEWKDGDSYFFFVTGSPLSGRNSCRVWSKKKGFRHLSAPSMAKLLKPAYTLVNKGSSQSDEHIVEINVPSRKPSSLLLRDLLRILKEA